MPDDIAADILGTVRAATHALYSGVSVPDDAADAPAAQTEHQPIVDDRPFRGDREARAAITCWLEDGAEIIRRCRVEGHDQGYCRDMLTEFALITLGNFDRYRGIDRDPLESVALRQWVERELAEAEARL